METWPPPGSFAKYAIDRKWLNAEDWSKEISTLRPEHLECSLGLAVLTLLRAGMPLNNDRATYLMSIHVLRFFLGRKWVSMNIGRDTAALSSEDVATREFLRTGRSDDRALIKHMERVRRLASHLYNLQGVPGINHRISLMRNEDLESALGELNCASIFAAPQFNLKFVTPSGRKGLDYDADFTTPSGRSACCEIKTKKEQTELTIKTINNTCEDARKQLPKGKPGIMFMSVPERWIHLPFVKERAEAAIDKVFRQSKRLVAVVVSWEEWTRYPEKFNVVRKYSPRYNHISPQYADDIAQSFQQGGSYQNPQWIRMEDYVRQHIEEMIPAIRPLAIRMTDVLSRHWFPDSPEHPS